MIFISWQLSRLGKILSGAFFLPIYVSFQIWLLANLSRHPWRNSWRPHSRATAVFEGLLSCFLSFAIYDHTSLKFRGKMLQNCIRVVVFTEDLGETGLLALTPQKIIITQWVGEAQHLKENQSLTDKTDIPWTTKKN